MRSLRTPAALLRLLAVCVLACALAASSASAAQGKREGKAGIRASVTAGAGTKGGWHGFGAGSLPDGSWRPYSDDSPFNQLATSAAVHPRSAVMVGRVLSWGQPGNLVAGNADSGSDYGHPTYYAQPTDPLYTLRSSGWSPSIQGHRIRIPSAARPAGGADGHMTIVQPDGWEYDLWSVTSKSAGGGTLTFAIGGRTHIAGDGLASNGVAARYGNLAGVIRAQELAAGRIDHALFVVLKCTSPGTAFGYGTRTDASSKSAFVYPALAGGARCGGADAADAPPMGVRFRLAMTDAQIAALNVPQWKKTILTALARYGGYVGDTGGPGFGLQFESGSTYTSFGTSDRLVDFAKAAKVTTWEGKHVFNMASGVDWARYLKVLAPPPAR